jgi:hypothetical protein
LRERNLSIVQKPPFRVSFVRVMPAFRNNC